jgi:hypothetical protein
LFAIQFLFEPAQGLIDRLSFSECHFRHNILNSAEPEGVGKPAQKSLDEIDPRIRPASGCASHKRYLFALDLTGRRRENAISASLVIGAEHAWGWQHLLE